MESYDCPKQCLSTVGTVNCVFLETEDLVVGGLFHAVNNHTAEYTVPTLLLGILSDFYEFIIFIYSSFRRPRSLPKL